MTRLPSAAHLAAWSGLALRVRKSAGGAIRVGAPHGNKCLISVLVEAGGSGGADAGRAN